MSTFQRVASLSQLDGGEILPVEIDGVAMVVYRHEGQVRACQRYCVHQGSDLSEGLLSRGYLICAAHGWRFDAESGVHEISAETCLATYAAKVEGEDVLVDPTPIRQGRAPEA